MCFYYDCGCTMSPWHMYVTLSITNAIRKEIQGDLAHAGKIEREKEREKQMEREIVSTRDMIV